VLIKNKNRVDKQFSLLVSTELAKLRKSYELSESIRFVFPSGGKKIMNNYTKYQNAVRFETRMKYISHFYLDLKALEQNGILRQYVNSIESLETNMKEEIQKRIISLRNQNKDKQGTIERDIASILDPSLKEYYLKLVTMKHN
jgi:hypothetical protein